MIDAPVSPDEQEAEQSSAVDDAEFLRISTEAWSASTTYFDANVRPDVEQDLRQWQGKHLSGSKYLSPGYAGRSKFFVPKTRTSITKGEAKAAEAMFSSLDVLNIEAEDKDDELGVAGAKFYKSLVQQRLTKAQPKGLPWFLTAIGAYQDAQVTGVCVSKTYWHPQHDRPAIDLIPVENFRFDPAADWRDPIGTSPYLIQVLPMYVKDVRKRGLEGKWRVLTDGELAKGVRRQSDTIRMQREGNRQDSQDIAHGVSDFNIVGVYEYIAEVDGVDMCWYTIGTETMLSNPVPLVEKYAHGRPHDVGFVVLEAHRHYPSSKPRLTRDVQREINELRNQRVDNISFVLNKRYFVKRGKQVDLSSLVRNVAGSATLMDDPEGDVRVVDTPDVTSSSFGEQDRQNLDFDDVAGDFSQSSVQSNRQLNETVGGLNLISTNANQVDNYRLRTFVETWCEPVLRKVVELERNYESDVDIVAAAVKMAAIDPAELATIGDALWDTQMSVTINIGMTATNPTERVNQLLFGLNAIKTLVADGALEQRGFNTEEASKEVMAMIGYRDGSRFFHWGDEDPMLAQLRQQIEQLQTALDAKHPPELLAAQVENLIAKTVKENVAAAYSAMQAGQVIASVPSVAPVADEVLKGAGWKPQPGVDPNFPQPAAPAPELVQGEVGDKRTGVTFMPGGNTNPMTPQPPPGAEAGMGQGIETMRADG